MDCMKCEMLITDEPIKIVDVHYDNPFMEDIYHFEYGFKCMFNGVESLNITDLQKANCRCDGAD